MVGGGGGGACTYKEPGVVNAPPPPFFKGGFTYKEPAFLYIYKKKNIWGGGDEGYI